MSLTYQQAHEKLWV